MADAADSVDEAEDFVDDVDRRLEPVPLLSKSPVLLCFLNLCRQSSAKLSHQILENKNFYKELYQKSSGIKLGHYDVRNYLITPFKRKITYEQKLLAVQ